jgi:hypothetical protein
MRISKKRKVQQTAKRLFKESPGLTKAELGHRVRLALMGENLMWESSEQIEDACDRAIYPQYYRRMSEGMGWS